MEINLEIPDQNIDTEGEKTSQKAAVDCVCFLMCSTDGMFFCACACVFLALQVVFGSLYRDDVLIKPSRVVSILAAACMLQLVSTLNEVSYCLICKITILILYMAVI